MANDINNFFVEKIQKIRTNLKSQAPTVDNSEEKCGILDVPDLPPSKLIQNFTLVDYKDVIKLVKSSPSRSHKLDLILTDLLKGMITELAPPIAAVVNSSQDVSSIHTKKNCPKTIVEEDQPGYHQEKLQTSIKPGISWQVD